jgi:PKD repeat protein
VKIKLPLIIIFLMLSIGCASAQLQPDQYTQILLHFDNGNANTSFHDETGRIWTSANGAAQSSETQDGSPSSLLVVKSGYQNIQTTNNIGLGPGTNNFTIEFQAKRNSIGNEQRIFGNMPDTLLIADSTFDIRYMSDNRVQFSVGDGVNGRFIRSKSTITDTNWHNYTFERQGRYIVMFIDGKYEGLYDVGPDFSVLPSSTAPFAIGTSGIAEWMSSDCYIDEFRYSVGISRIQNGWMDWYAYGDSNTDATNEGLTPNDGSLCYVFQMTANNNSLTADHAIGGYGMLTDWGLENIEKYYPYPKNFIVMFGSNDAHIGVSAATAAQNVKNIYNYTTAHGSNTVICVPPLASDVGGYYALAYQQSWLESFQSNLAGYPVIKGYDATDTTPGNGEPEAINTSLFESDGRHLNELGQVAHGNFIYSELSGKYTVSPTSGNAPLMVAVHYSNNVTNPISVNTDFENDSVTDVFSNSNPVHVYGTAGTYSINLIPQNNFGYFPIVKTDYITVSAPAPIDTVGKLYWWIRGYFGWLLPLQEAC